jgi:hypothetical protein
MIDRLLKASTPQTHRKYFVKFFTWEDKSRNISSDLRMGNMLYIIVIV